MNRSDSDAKLVIDDDVKIDQDEIGHRRARLHDPSRGGNRSLPDLRFVMLALKVVSDLERIGDLAVNIAKRSRDLNRHEPSNQQHLNLLTDKVLDALKGALDAFANTDIAAAERVITSDHDIDSLNMHVIADVISTGAEHAHEIARRLAILFGLALSRANRRSRHQHLRDGHLLRARPRRQTSPHAVSPPHALRVARPAANAPAH